LQGADILFGNFESTLTNHRRSAKDTSRALVFAFRNPPDYAKVLKDVGFDVLSVANNHSFDFSRIGFSDTIANIELNGMYAVGAKDSIVYATRNGLTLAFIGFSYLNTHNSINDLASTRALVSEAERNADITIVSFHGGAEGTSATRVRNRQERFYGENRGNLMLFSRAAVDSGADLVLGHGPHVPRAMELYKGKLIAYSLGNFIGYRTLSTSGILAYSLILEARLNEQGDLIDGKIIPIYIHRPGIPKYDDGFNSVRLIRQLTQQDFPNTPLAIESNGDLRVK